MPVYVIVMVMVMVVKVLLLQTCESSSWAAIVQVDKAIEEKEGILSKLMDSVKVASHCIALSPWGILLVYGVPSRTHTDASYRSISSYTWCFLCVCDAMHARASRR